MNIDWSKAPEEATHALTTGPRWDGSSTVAGEIRYAVRRNKSYVEVGDPEDATFCMGKRSWVVVAKRPAPWTGEGLPPVGTVCEVCSDLGSWEVCTVLAHNGADVVFVDATGVYGGLDESRRFRPIRTPEQIAAEEREKAVDEMVTVWKRTMGRFAQEERGLAEMLYDAGYRK